MAETPSNPTSKRARYFARMEGASFNISNLIEDTIESIVEFGIRFGYTTALMIWSPRKMVFHILNRNRKLNISRPYTYLFASLLLVAASVTFSIANESYLADGIESQFPTFASPTGVRDFLANPNAVKTLTALAPTLFTVLFGAWLGAIVVSPILVPIRRVRRLATPIHFSLVFTVALYFVSISIMLLSEVLFRVTITVPHTESNSSMAFGPEALYPLLAMAVLLTLAVVVGITLWRLLWAVQGRAFSSRWVRIARAIGAWILGSSATIGSIVLAVGLTSGLHAVSTDVDKIVAPKPSPPQISIDCKPSESEPRSFIYAGGSPFPSGLNGLPNVPFLHSGFDFLLINNSDIDLDLMDTMDVGGRTGSCFTKNGASSCYSKPLLGSTELLGHAKIVQPVPSGALVVVSKRARSGIRIQIQDLTPVAAGANFVSLQTIFLRSASSGYLTGPTSETNCAPFERAQGPFDSSFPLRPAALPSPAPPHAGQGSVLGSTKQSQPH